MKFTVKNHRWKEPDNDQRGATLQRVLQSDRYKALEKEGWFLCAVTFLVVTTGQVTILLEMKIMEG